MFLDLQEALILSLDLRVVEVLVLLEVRRHVLQAQVESEDKLNIYLIKIL